MMPQTKDNVVHRGPPMDCPAQLGKVRSWPAPAWIFALRALGWSGGVVEPNRQRFVVEEVSIELRGNEGEWRIGDARRRGG
jgi:hypothetical protein